LDAVGQVVYQQALRWLPAEQPVYLLGDDTLARKSGKCVSLAAMHHDPLLSTARKPFFSFEHVWVVAGVVGPAADGPRPGGRADDPGATVHRDEAGWARRCAVPPHD